MITNNLIKTQKIVKPDIEIIKLNFEDIITSSSKSSENGINLPIHKF